MGRRAGGALAPRERRHQNCPLDAHLAKQACDFTGRRTARRSALRRREQLEVGWVAGFRLL
jgi:hypothetical protein